MEGKKEEEENGHLNPMSNIVNYYVLKNKKRLKYLVTTSYLKQTTLNTK